MLITRRHFAGATLGLSLTPTLARAQGARFAEVLAAARGQTVFWNAWGGDERTNAFIAWLAQESQRRFGVTITHVRLRDTAEAVTRVVAEKQAGRLTGGSVDLIWINGPNLLAMKAQGLLHGPFVETLPHWSIVDTVNKPSTVTDFTVPVEGMAAPWRMAQVVFVYDAARTPLSGLPKSMAAMVDWARAHPGRLTHPNARNFLGATFLKQALMELAVDRERLGREATESEFAANTAPLWDWYDQLRPHLWRQGREFPESGPAQRQMLNDGEIDMLISFNPAEAAVAIANRLLPSTARAYVLAGGTIGNTSFVAIPFNASHKEGAMVVANMLLEPAVQARAQDPRHLGSFTVLDLDRLSPGDRQHFNDLSAVPALPTNAELGRPLPEPHPSWMTRITAVWEQRVVR